MKPRTLSILWIIALLLGLIVFIIKTSDNSGTQNKTARIAGQTLVDAFPATQTSSIVISGADQSVTLEIKDGKWTVKERDSFPANTLTVNEFIRTLTELKVTQGIQAGPSFAPRFGMDEKSSDPVQRGITASFLDAAGKELSKISFGKNLDTAAPASPYGGGATGRYIRNHADESGFYAVSEVFGTLSNDPKSWLADDFIKVERIKSISLSKPGSNQEEFALIRDDDKAEFKFTDAFPGVKIDPAATSPLKSLFSYARFDDVVPATKLAERSNPAKVQKANITTFDGFTYDLSLQPTKATTAAPSNQGEPPASEEYLMEIKVRAELPKERTKSDGEKPEEAEAATKAFAERLKSLTESLVKAKALEGRTFVVSKFTLDALLKGRAELMSKGAGTGADTPSLPPGISAVTPPIEIPAAPSTPKTEPVVPPAPAPVVPAPAPKPEPVVPPAPAPVVPAPAPKTEPVVPPVPAPAPVVPAPAPKTEPVVPPAPAPVVPAPAPKTEPVVPPVPAPAPAPVVPAPTSKTEPVVPSAPAPVVPAPAPKPEPVAPQAPAPVVPAPTSKTEPVVPSAPAPIVPAPAPKPEPVAPQAPAPVVPAPTSKTEPVVPPVQAPAPVVPAPTPKPEPVVPPAPAPIIPDPTPKTEPVVPPAPAPVIPAPTPKPEPVVPPAPAPVVPAPAPKPEPVTPAAPAPVSPAPTPKTEPVTPAAPAPVSPAQAPKTEP